MIRVYGIEDLHSLRREDAPFPSRNPVDSFLALYIYRALEPLPIQTSTGVKIVTVDDEAKQWLLDRVNRVRCAFDESVDNVQWHSMFPTDDRQALIRGFLLEPLALEALRSISLDSADGAQYRLMIAPSYLEHTKDGSKGIDILLAKQNPGDKGFTLIGGIDVKSGLPSGGPAKYLRRHRYIPRVNRALEDSIGYPPIPAIVLWLGGLEIENIFGNRQQTFEFMEYTVKKAARRNGLRGFLEGMSRSTVTQFLDETRERFSFGCDEAQLKMKEQVRDPEVLKRLYLLLSEMQTFFGKPRDARISRLQAS